MKPAFKTNSYFTNNKIVVVRLLPLQWCVPHKKAAGKFPGDVGEHLHASVWSHDQPPQSSRASPLPGACEFPFTGNQIFPNRSHWETLSNCYFVVCRVRWWASTAWTMSLNQSTTFSIWTVRCQSTGQKKITLPTPTTSTTPMPTWLCSTTCEGMSQLWFFIKPPIDSIRHLNHSQNTWGSNVVSTV